MKVFLHYEECLEEDLKMTVKLTLPKKWRSGPAQRLVDTFVEAYNKKHSSEGLDESLVHFEKKDGFVVPFDAPVESFMESGEDLYLKSGPGQTMSALGFEPTTEAVNEDPAATTTVGSSASSAKSASSMAAARAAADAKAAAEAGVGKRDQSKPSAAELEGTVMCMRFGCNKRYRKDANSETSCRHHAKPPVFHETRKFWACCPDKIAWDWASFQDIEGCQVSCHSDQKQSDQLFLGGSDVRKEQEEAHAQSTPQRLDAPPKAALDKVSTLRKALVDMGVAGALFDKARDALVAKQNAEGSANVWENVSSGLAKRIALSLQELAD